MWHLLDYGRSLLRFAILTVLLIGIFAGIYAFFTDMIDYGKQPRNSFTPVYFSIVTFSTLGFGDITPKTPSGQITVALQACLGYCTLGLLVSVLGNTLLRLSS